ncbi:tripartite motif-containing protein 75-like [Trichechus inunguis]|uniref:Tripartite motif-containing protein 75 n=1 Tax=Trichechus manatus latirostris TaxID=127582 RepID=A0A2Y9EBM2_TRIMA|nr:putative tripartite motif-containing protein 75 [Trichechus manatus latirostris]
MAFAVSLADLQAEAYCPICLDYLRDPVTIACGHNFCRSCIHQSWEGLRDIFPCPICLHHCCNGNLKQNTQLCNMTDIVKQIPTMRSKRKRQEEKPLCEKHNQELSLFCEKDLELLCPQCKISNHQDHHLMPIDQAATSHRRKLKYYVELLKKQVGNAEKELKIQVSKSFELKIKVENQMGELYSDFEQVKDVLEKEKDVILFTLQIEEKDIQKKLSESRVIFSEHISTLKNLLVEITEKCVQSELELLTGIESIYNKYENLSTPTVFSYELKKKYISSSEQYFNLQKKINLFKVNLTLDIETAHPNLVISEDRKSVTLRKMNPNYLQNSKKFSFLPALLSSQGFVSGRHYWQVEVRGKGEWAVGVCKESFPRDTITSPSPKDGCWQIRLWSYTFDALNRIKSRRVGIFLDYELGEVSFYNLNNKTLIYTFNDTFREKLRPYFYVGPYSDLLTIQIVNLE